MKERPRRNSQTYGETGRRSSRLLRFDCEVQGLRIEIKFGVTGWLPPFVASRTAHALYESYRYSPQLNH